MKKVRKQYDREFKERAVKLYTRSNRTQKEIAEELGVERSLFGKWCRSYENNRGNPFPGHGNPQDEELYRLRRELRDVKEERDILKKAMAVFSRKD